MKKSKEQIIKEINNLLIELASFGDKVYDQINKAGKDTRVQLTGCIGAIQELIEEGFFETQKTVSQVLEKLKEEGQPYSKPLVSMNLLNLVKPPRKILRRIKENDQWQYIIRK